MFTSTSLPRLFVAALTLAALAGPVLAQEEEPLSCADSCHADAMARHEDGMQYWENNEMYLRCIAGC